VPLAAYNIPELKGKSLVLNFDVIARIYLGEITSWNDSRIRDLNSADVAAVLPNKPIVVVVQTVASAITKVFTTVLNQTVPDWSVVRTRVTWRAHTYTHTHTHTIEMTTQR
jgi:ABC-type phosphate transport system substrate-binding protein